MKPDVKIFHYIASGRVRITTETQIAYFTKAEWEVIERYCDTAVRTALTSTSKPSTKTSNWD